jgi:hypothetical protein
MGLCLKIKLWGGKIHGSIRKQLIYMFESKIEEGQIYEISGFSVYPESGFYRTTLHPYKIGFQLKTKLKKGESDSITEYGLSLSDIGEVLSHTNGYEYLVGECLFCICMFPEY